MHSSITRTEAIILNRRLRKLMEHEDGLVKHFKGGLYVIKGVFEHTETQELMVGYKSASTGLNYVRPVNMFLSEVDKEAYPDVDQVHRFEFIDDNTEVTFDMEAWCYED